MLYSWIFLIFIYSIVISVYLFVCPIIPHEPQDRFTSNFDWGTRQKHGNVLSLVLYRKFIQFSVKAGFQSQFILSFRKYAGSQKFYPHDLLIFASFLIRKIMVFIDCDQSPLSCEDISARFTLDRVGKPSIYHFLLMMVFILYIT